MGLRPICYHKYKALMLTLAVLELFYDNLIPLYCVANGHLDELQKAEIADTSKLVSSVIIKTHYWINHR